MISDSALWRLQSFRSCAVHLSLCACTPKAQATLSKPDCKSILWLVASMQKTHYYWSTLTATNVCTSEVHFRWWHPMITWHWVWEAFPWMMCSYSSDTLCSMKCIYSQRPTQFCRSTAKTSMTLTTSAHKYCGRSKFTNAMNILWLHLLSLQWWPVTNQMHSIVRQSASEKQTLLVRALMVTLNNVQSHQISVKSPVVLESQGQEW